MSDKLENNFLFNYAKGLMDTSGASSNLEAVDKCYFALAVRPKTYMHGEIFKSIQILSLKGKENIGLSLKLLKSCSNPWIILYQEEDFLKFVKKEKHIKAIKSN